MKNAKNHTATTKMQITTIIKDYKSIEKLNTERISRIYYGEEFCERLMPSKDKVLEAKKEAKKFGINFSLITPIMTDKGLKNLKETIEILDQKDEIIVNDIGTLNLIHSEYQNPIIIGRVLGRNFIEMLGRFKSDLDTAEKYILTHSDRIKIIETDFLKSNLITKDMSQRFNLGFYNMPFFWTITRRCAFNTNSKSLDKFTMCKKECKNTSAIINNTCAEKDFLLEGNKMLDIDSPKEKIDINLFKRVVIDSK